MPHIIDQRYLQQDQYARPNKLSARTTVHARFSRNPQNWHEWVFDHLELAGAQQVLEQKSSGVLVARKTGAACA